MMLLLLVVKTETENTNASLATASDDLPLPIRRKIEGIARLASLRLPTTTTRRTATRGIMLILLL